MHGENTLEPNYSKAASAELLARQVYYKEYMLRRVGKGIQKEWAEQVIRDFDLPEQVFKDTLQFLQRSRRQPQYTVQDSMREDDIIATVQCAGEERRRIAELERGIAALRPAPRQNETFVSGLSLDRINDHYFRR